MPEVSLTISGEYSTEFVNKWAIYLGWNESIEIPQTLYIFSYYVENHGKPRVKEMEIAEIIEESLADANIEVDAKLAGLSVEII